MRFRSIRHPCHGTNPPMRRLARWLLNALTVLSLLLCVAGGGLWGPSFLAQDEVHFRRERVTPSTSREAMHGLFSRRGRLAWAVTEQAYDPLPAGTAEAMAAERRRMVEG